MNAEGLGPRNIAAVFKILRIAAIIRPEQAGHS